MEFGQCLCSSQAFFPSPLPHLQNSGDLVTTRAATERLAKNLQFSIAGVTFDNRQVGATERVL